MMLQFETAMQCHPQCHPDPLTACLAACLAAFALLHNRRNHAFDLEHQEYYGKVRFPLQQLQHVLIT